MADFSALKTAIQTYIKQNGNEEITGEKLQEILLSVVTTLGDSAINDLITALANEVAARQNADGTLQQNITNEATARGNADTALSNRLGSSITAENTAADQIGAEAEARAAADTALQNLIDGITDNIENGYVYAGIATPSSTPATGKVFYLALTAGTYTNFGSTEVSQGINILKYNGSAWSLDAFIGIDDEPTPNSPKLVKSGGAFDSVMTNGSAFDISAHFASGGTLATYADLSAALTALNTLSASYKRGGMSIKYVQSSDNKYVQARCMAQSFTTDVTQWQGVDKVPVVESHNLVESGGTFYATKGVGENIGIYDFSIDVTQNTAIDFTLNKSFATGDKITVVLYGDADAVQGGLIAVNDENDSLLTNSIINQERTVTLNHNVEYVKFVRPANKVLSTATLKGKIIIDIKDRVNSIVSSLGSLKEAGYLYAGIVTASTEINTPTEKVFYIATEAGTYTHFGNLVVAQGINILKYNGSAWSQEQVLGIDNEPTNNSTKVAKSGGIVSYIDKLISENLGAYKITIPVVQNTAIDYTLNKPFKAGDKITIVLNGDASAVDSGLIIVYDDNNTSLGNAVINQIKTITVQNDTTSIKFSRPANKVSATTTIYGNALVGVYDLVKDALPRADYEADINGIITTLSPTTESGSIDADGNVSDEYAAYSAINKYLLNGCDSVIISLTGESRTYPHYAFYNSETINSANVIGEVGSTKDISGSEVTLERPAGAVMLAISYRTTTTTVSYVKSKVVGRIEAINNKVNSAVQKEDVVNYEKAFKIKCGADKFGNNNIVTFGDGWSGNFANGFVKVATSQSSKLEFDASSLFSVGDRLLIKVDTTANISPHRVYVTNGTYAKIDLYHGGKGGIAGIIYEGGSIKIDASADTANTFFVTCQKIDANGDNEITIDYANLIYSNANTILSGFWVTKIGGDHVLGNAIDISRTIAIGQYTLDDYKYGDRNIAIGTFAMPNVIKGYSNVAIGIDTIYPITEADMCVSVGQNAIIGAKAKRATGVGYAALGGSDNSKNITDCVGVGYYAGSAAQTECTCIGAFSGRFASGIRNTSVGCYANDTNGQAVQGDENVFIGYKAHISSSLANGASNSIAIGANAEITKSNQVVIGNSSTEEIVLGNKKLVFNNDNSVTWETIS